MYLQFPESVIGKHAAEVSAALQFGCEGIADGTMPAPVIYYIRHGETSWNAQGRLQGTRDIALNDLGRRQAVHAGAILADIFKREGRDTSALPFVASPLSRARTTMELVRGTLELPLLDYALDDRLREIGYGVWEGSTLAEMQAADPVLYARRLTA